MKTMIWKNDAAEKYSLFEKEHYFDSLGILEENEKWLFCDDSIEDEFAEACSMLDFETGGEIIAFADFQRWDGKHCGVKQIGLSICDCLESVRRLADGDSVEVFVEGDELKAHLFGHDNPVNPTVLVFRSVKKKGPDPETIMDGYLYGGSNRWNYVNSCTAPIGKKISAALNWN